MISYRALKDVKKREKKPVLCGSVTVFVVLGKTTVRYVTVSVLPIKDHNQANLSLELVVVKNKWNYLKRCDLATLSCLRAVSLFTGDVLPSVVWYRG